MTRGPEARYRGLRMTADKYLALPDDGFRYELMDGVVSMSPSASYWHQRLQFEIARQIDDYLRQNPIGEVVTDIDVRLRDDLVYRPDVVFLTTAKAAGCHERVTEIPDVVVEGVSPDSRVYDSETKRGDYQAAGVAEYGLIDPQRNSFRFFVRRGDSFHEPPPSKGVYAATVLPNFQLDLQRLRAAP